MWRDRQLLEILDVADGAALAELRALAPSMSVGALDRWLDSAVVRGLVEPSRAGYEERWRLTRSGRAELDRVVIQETVDPGSTGPKS